MSDLSPGSPVPARGSAWKWWVCGLLLLATMLNYMDRLTLNLLSSTIMDELQLDEGHYGQLESAFAYAFALGAIVTGWMADRWNVWWIYPAAVVAWSAAGFVTGLAEGFFALLVCRFFLGLAEAGNWPCALKTTQRIVPPEERSLGNGILQSGAAVGAILTPLIVLALAQAYSSWRPPFLVIGAVGVTWAFLWLAIVRRRDLAPGATPPAPAMLNILALLISLLALDIVFRVAAVSGLSQGVLHLASNRWFPEAWTDTLLGWALAVEAVPRLVVKVFVCVSAVTAVCLWFLRATRDDPTLPRPLFIRRFLVLMVITVTINTTWHFFRAWLPLFLERQHGYEREYAVGFMSFYYISTVLGSLAVGFVVLTLTRSGLAVHTSRVLVFAGCAALTTLSLGAAFLGKGPVLLGVLLIIGFGSLGLYPNYYSFSQELTTRHQGKVSGSLGCINWMAMYLLHDVIGESVKTTGSYSLGLAAAGLAPLIALAVLVLFWGQRGVSPPVNDA